MKHAYSHVRCEKEQRLIKLISGCLRKVEWRWKKTGFWVVTRMSGFTEKEGLQTWTVLLAILAVVGFVQVMLLSWILPLV
jgi:GntP family gluconate:H+ symporter